MSIACPHCGLFHPSGSSCTTLAVQPLAAPGSLAPGTLLAGRYSIARTIHRGGMSVVYQAEDRVQGRRRVALKELRIPHDATAQEGREAEAWFARESFVLSSHQHPLIPTFYSVFREDGRAYIVQEYIEGENLDDRVKRLGPIDEVQVVAWGQVLCGFLSYLHGRPEAPLIYRDLKPANVILRAYDLRLAVVDFGIAKPIRRGEVGTVIGTPGYAPPEQYQGLASPESDVYALGATLHRLLTGYDPEQGPPFSFPPVRELNPAVSPTMAAIVARAVQIDPAARYASAAQMGAALAGLGRELRMSKPHVGWGAQLPGPGADVGRSWLGACILPMAGVALFAADSSGHVLVGGLAAAAILRIARASLVPGDRGLWPIAQHAAATGALSCALGILIAQQWDGWFVLSLSMMVLGLVVTFLVGDGQDPDDLVTWARYMGYALVALVSAAILFSLTMAGPELPFPMGTIFLIAFGTPGAALGGLCGGVLRALTD